MINLDKILVKTTCVMITQDQTNPTFFGLASAQRLDWNYLQLYLIGSWQFVVIKAYRISYFLQKYPLSDESQYIYELILQFSI